MKNIRKLASPHLFDATIERTKALLNNMGFSASTENGALPLVLNLSKQYHLSAMFALPEEHLVVSIMTTSKSSPSGVWFHINVSHYCNTNSDTLLLDFEIEVAKNDNNILTLAKIKKAMRDCDHYEMPELRLYQQGVLVQVAEDIAALGAFLYQSDLEDSGIQLGGTKFFNTSYQGPTLYTGFELVLPKDSRDTLTPAEAVEIIQSWYDDDILDNNEFHLCAESFKHEIKGGALRISDENRDASVKVTDEGFVVSVVLSERLPDAGKDIRIDDALYALVCNIAQLRDSGLITSARQFRLY